MKWFMIDNYGHIHNTTEVQAGVDRTAVVEYFSKIKKIDPKDFSKIFRVMTENEMEAFERRPSHEGEFGDWLDMEKS